MVLSDFEVYKSPNMWNFNDKGNLSYWRRFTWSLRKNSCFNQICKPVLGKRRGLLYIAFSFIKKCTWKIYVNIYVYRPNKDYVSFFECLDNITIANIDKSLFHVRRFQWSTYNLTYWTVKCTQIDWSEVIIYDLYNIWGL